MKKTIAITSALAAVTGLATAEIKINDFLSFEGFVDMSYSHTDVDSDSGSVGSGRDSSYDIDQVEIDWLFSFDKVTARVDLAHEGSDSSFDTEVEQAFVTYDLGGGSAVTAGRYQSMLGLEAFEPTGLYQYSFAYDLGFSGIGSDTSSVSVLPGYAGGVKYTREANGNFFGLSVQDQTTGNDAGRLGGSGDSSIGVEAAFSTELGDGLTWFLGGAWEDADAGDSWVANTYVTYETGALTLGAELNIAESDVGGPASNLLNLSLTDEETTQGMIMANYAYNDCSSITGRISYSDHEAAGGVEADFLKYTLAHNYAVTDNLAIVGEVSFVDGEIAGDDVESLVGAVEVLFSF